MVKGYAETCGWYLYCVAVPEALLVTVGLAVITGPRWFPLAAAGGGLILAAFDLYTVDLQLHLWTTRYGNISVI
jgi:hypothetical protein